MRKQDHLVQLIATLSANEKRYFKLFGSTQAGEKRYLKLFEALENKTTYDVQELSQELGISTAQLTAEKHYLSQVLLQALRNFDSEANAVSNLHNSLVEARALFLRGLYDYSLDYTEKILKRALALEVTYLIPEIIMQKQSCLRQLGRYEELKELDKENQIAMQRHNELFEIMQLNFAITYAEQHHEITTETEKLFEHTLLHKKIDEIQGTRAFIIWFKLLSRRHTMLNQEKHKWLKFVESSIKRGENSPEIFEINPLGFLYMYTDWAMAEIAVNNYEMALNILHLLTEKLQKPPAAVPKGGLEDAKLFTSGLKMNVLRKLGRIAEALGVAEKLGAPLSTFSNYNQLTYLFEHALLLFQVGQMDRAMDKLNHSLQINVEGFNGVAAYPRPLQVIFQLELGNYQTVPYLIKSARQWMKRKEISIPEIETFFSLAYAIAAAPQTQQRKRWLALKQAAEEGKLGDLDKEINIKGWLERKLRN